MSTKNKLESENKASQENKQSEDNLYSDRIASDWNDDDAWGEFEKKKTQELNKEKDLFPSLNKQDDLKKMDSSDDDEMQKMLRDIPNVGLDKPDEKAEFNDFNKVMSTSKENGGLLGSLGLKKEISGLEDSI